jgi:DNA-binding CsgD family transcriptional regulator
MIRARQEVAMGRFEAALGAIVDAIGTPPFPAVAANALAKTLAFDLTAVILHGPASARILHDDFGRAGARAALETYCRITRKVNPMLKGAGGRAVRARDFAGRALRWPPAVAAHLSAAPEEELGFRTIGWPERMEEVGLYLDGGDGVVELSLYRARGRTSLADRDLRRLAALSSPVAAAFRRQTALCPSAWRERLTRREAEIADLLRLGCSSEAVALRLGLTRHTVKDYRKRIYRKLGISSLAELFALVAHPPLGGSAAGADLPYSRAA